MDVKDVKEMEFDVTNVVEIETEELEVVSAGNCCCCCCVTIN